MDALAERIILVAREQQRTFSALVHHDVYSQHFELVYGTLVCASDRGASVNISESYTVANGTDTSIATPFGLASSISLLQSREYQSKRNGR